MWKWCPALSAAMQVLENSQQAVLALLLGGCSRNVSAASSGQHGPPAAIYPCTLHATPAPHAVAVASLISKYQEKMRGQEVFQY